MPYLPSPPRPIPALAASALLALAVWFWLGRPVPLEAPPVTAPIRCLSYTHYREDQSPFDPPAGNRPLKARVEEDLKRLSGITSCLRLYGSEGMEPVLEAAQKFRFRLLLGAWVSGDEAATRREIEALVRLANRYPETVRGVLVGNEALLRHDIEPERLAALIREVGQRVSQPVSYADVWEFLLRYPRVAEASDFLTIHVLPYWEDQPVAVEDALEHLRNIRAQVVARYPDKPVLIGETGWPGSGRMRDGALPSRVNEARYLRRFLAAAQAQGWDYNLIEAFDQPWKRALEGTVGGHWGIFDAARHDKGLLDGAVSNHPRWPGYALAAVVLSVALSLGLRAPFRMAPAVALVAVGWTLLAEQLQLVAGDGLQVAGALLLLGVSLMASLALLARQADRPWTARREAASVLALGGIAAVLTLWLVFDPRYRDFFVAGLLPASLLMWWPDARPAPAIGSGREAIAIGVLLSLGAPFIVVREGLLNHQALLWATVTLLLGIALIRRGVLRPMAS